MNRTDRLYALVEELRAATPRPRSARVLAARFEVSVRTIERDLAALQQSGVPVYAEPGRSGGYVLDRQRTLPPLAITPAEATALAVGLHALAGTPFAADARSALHKVLAVMPEGERAAAMEMTGRVQLLVPAAATARSAEPVVPAPLREALTAGRVLRLEYTDAAGVPSTREVEPIAFLGGEHWYLAGWCRLREAPRGFRLDRIRAVEALDDRIPERRVDLTELDTLGSDLVPLPDF